MKVFYAAVLFFVVSLLSLAALAQSPTSTPTSAASPTTTNATDAQTGLSSSTSPPAAGRADRPNLPYLVEGLACAVMVGSVLAVYMLVRQQLRSGQGSIGPRHIQFVSVCLIVPTILILGLEQWLSRETTATLIGGLTGYLLSGLGKSDPPGNGGDDKTKTPEPSPNAMPSMPTLGTPTPNEAANPGMSVGSVATASAAAGNEAAEVATIYGETRYAERRYGEIPYGETSSGETAAGT